MRALDVRLMFMQARVDFVIERAAHPQKEFSFSDFCIDVQVATCEMGANDHHQNVFDMPVYFRNEPLLAKWYTDGKTAASEFENWECPFCTGGTCTCHDPREFPDI